MERVRGQNGRVALLILYGIGITLLSVVGLWRQSLMVRQLARWGVGDLGVAARAAGPARSILVLEVEADSPALGMLQPDDRALRATDMELVVLPPTRRLFAIPDPVRGQEQPVQPGRPLTLVFQREDQERRAALRLREEDTWAPLDPGGPLGRFLFATLLPTWLTQWGFLVVGWLVFARRPRARDAQLFFLLFVTGALSFSSMFGRPALYPMPLRWLCEHSIVVGAWVGTLAAHFAHAVPEGKEFYQRFRRPLLATIYLPAVAVTGLGVAATLQPAARPALEWLWPRFGLLYWVPAMLLVAAGLLESATTASTSARRRQGRTLLLGLLPFLVLTISDELYAAIYGEPLAANLPVVYIAQSGTTLLIPVTFGYAILREGLLDLGVVLRRGLVYAAVIAVGVAGYYLLVLGTGQVLVALTGQTSPFVTMAATLALATLLRPVAAQFRRLVDQAFYRDRLETARRLRALSQEILSLLDRDAILTQLTARLPAVFPAAAATLFLYDPADDAYRQAGAAAEGARTVLGARCSEDRVLGARCSVLGSDIDPTGPILSEPSTEHRAPSTLSSEHRAPSTVLAPPLAARESLLVRRLQKSGRPVGTYDVEAHSAEAILTLADRELARRLGAVLWLPIMLRDSLVGMLALGWKASEEIYTEEELDALCLIASEAAVALENAAFSEQRAQQARLQQEVAIARSIQMRLLPATRLCLEGCEVLSRSEPAAEVGGDFYNVFEVGRPSGKEGERKRDGGAEGVGPGPGEGEKGDRAGDPLTARPAQPVSPSLPLSLPPSTTRLGVLLGDVSGKGVPGALFMAVTTTLVEAQARLLSSPAETLAAANAQLHPKMRHPGDGHPPMFATAVYGILDTQRREIRLANAGQTPPIHWPAGGTPRYIRLTGVPLGALSGSTYAEATVVLAPGDRLLLCSDGFIEATDDAGQPVGYAGFLRRVAALGDRSGPELIEALFAAEPAISDDGPDRDDRTLVLITVR